jgi:hypothetical protein
MDKSKQLIDGRTVHWSDTDLTDAFVFIRRVPRPYHHGLYGMRPSKEADDYLATFEKDIRETFGNLVPFSNELRPRFYQVPPDAGPDTDFIFTLAANVDSVIQTLETYLSLGAMLIEFFRLRKRRDADVEHRYDKAYPGGMYTGVRMLESMCLYHAHSRYYDPKRHPALTVTSYSRSVHVGDVDHPAPNVQYTTTVSVGSARYVYVTQANAEVLEHFRIEGTELIGLPRPNWLDPETGYLGDRVTQLPTRTLGSVPGDSTNSGQLESTHDGVRSPVPPSP